MGMKKKSVKKRSLPSRELYPVHLTIDDCKQLEAKQKVVKMVNSNGMWPILFELAHDHCDWLYVLKVIERKAK
jgi:hypothetical protein